MIRSRLAVLALLSLAAPGCSQLAASYDVTPDGLLRAEHRLRRQLSAGRADSALLALRRGKDRLPGDALLRALFEGTAAHYAGEHARAAAAFERAVVIADDRTATSLSRGALSLVVNDFSLAYEPGPTEQLLIPYYAALTYLGARDYAGAAVEARRLSAKLQRLQADGGPADRPLHAALRYFAGAVFEAAGEPDDADVAYRNAQALDSLPLPETVTDDTLGTVLVVVEHGFAPHRVQESILLPLTDAESHAVDRDRSDDDRHAAAEQIAERVLRFALDSGPRADPAGARMLRIPPSATKAADASCDATGPCRRDHDDDHSYLLRFSWPALAAPTRPTAALRVAADSTPVPRVAFADVAGGVHADFRREQPAILARAIVRAAAKAALKRSAEESAGRKHEALGDVVGALVNATAVVTEQADTRSWHLVPSAITLYRLRLPAGEHRLRLDADVPLALPVTVRPGRLDIVRHRAWR